jgi:hypothetical protein
MVESTWGYRGASAVSNELARMVSHGKDSDAQLIDLMVASPIDGAATDDATAPQATTWAEL